MNSHIEFTKRGAEQHALSFLQKLSTEYGAIVSSGICSEMEIANARATDRFFVDNEGLGYVLRTQKWRELAEEAIHDFVSKKE